MKFCILCIGSHGDIRPYIALGIGLKKRGHEVCIASHQQAEFLCSKYHLNFSRVDGDLTELLNTTQGREILWESGRKKLFFLKELMKEFKRVLEIQLPMSVQVAKGSDVLIYSPAAFAGPHLGEYLGIPSFLMTLQPDGRTKKIPSCLFPNLKRFGAVGCLLSYFFAEQQFWQPIRAHINKWRKHSLGMRKMNFWGPKADPIARNIPRIIALNPAIIERPDDWPSGIHMTNFCRIMEGEQWDPPEDLQKFCEEKPALYVSFGSLTEACPESITKKIINVLIKNRIRSIVNEDLPGVKSLKLPPWIFLLKYAPHDWLLPQVDAIVHHGGVGTTGAGLYAGCPTMVVPFIVDQFFWGEKIWELGIGPQSLAAHYFEGDAFESRVKDLLTNPSYRENAQSMQSKLNSSEDGVEMTMNTIFDCLNKRGTK